MIMRRKIIPYNPNLKLIARELRNNSTSAQIKLWLQLKTKKMRGYDFHRQKPIANFIIDFFCHELMLGIEIQSSGEMTDSNSTDHTNQLHALGIEVLQFTEEQVVNDPLNVVSIIDNYISEFEKHTPNPSQEGKHPRQ